MPRKFGGATNDFECPCGKCPYVPDILSVCWGREVRAERCDPLVNKSCQISLSWRYRSSSGSQANTRYSIRELVQHDEMALSHTSLL